MKRLSIAEIEAGKTAKGGFTRAQLQKWGVAWPPPKGWLSALKQDARLGIEPVAWPKAKPVVKSKSKSKSKSKPVAGSAPEGYSGYSGPEPDSPEFDPARHGLLAPPRMSYQRIRE